MKHRIARVNFTGRWVEVWFGEEHIDGSEYSECCKGYMLCDLVEQADLECRVTDRGYIGLWVTWVKGEDKPTRIETGETVRDAQAGTCATCKHWRCGEMLRKAIRQYADDPNKDDGDWEGECPVLLEVLQIEEDLYDSGIDSIETPWDFGCNKWEGK